MSNLDEDAWKQLTSLSEGELKEMIKGVHEDFYQKRESDKLAVFEEAIKRRSLNPPMAWKEVTEEINKLGYKNYSKPWTKSTLCPLFHKIRNNIMHEDFVKELEEKYGYIHKPLYPAK